MKFLRLIILLVSVSFGSLHAGPPQLENRASIFSGVYEAGEFESLTFVNSIVGWDTFFNAGYLGAGRVLANAEAGFIWEGHEVFLRPDGVQSAVELTLAGDGVTGEIDFHATMVGHVMAGTGYIAGSDPAQYTMAGLGIAPHAAMWSGAVATAFSSVDLGSFSTTFDSVVSVYRSFFEGIGGIKPDAINSSWGGGDPAAASPEMLALDGLARQNESVLLVSSAGNSGLAPVSAPGALFNGITVGSLGGADFDVPSSFSSSGLADFYNPSTGQTLSGVRSAVALSAPGEFLALAAYLGPTGGLQAAGEPALTDPSPGDLFFLNLSGTSFASPAVAGAIALLREAAENDTFYNLNGVASAGDSRVLKSVLMAGATKTQGWDNGQQVLAGGVISTSDSLDPRAGAGRVNLDNTAGIYLLAGTRDVAGLVGGMVSSTGWDFGNVATGGANSYIFDNPFETPVELTASLNWFMGRSFDDEIFGSEGYFADLNLEVWQLEDGLFSALIAESVSIYNNSEFLRVELMEGSYGLRVTFHGLVFDTSPDGIAFEEYGLAWSATAIPEPTTGFLLLIFFSLLALLHRRKSVCS